VKSRERTTVYGQTFEVPQHIVRLDGDRVHGWQVRLGEWKLFSDFSSDGSGAERALTEAIKELASRMTKLPAATGLRTETLSWKASELPLGISKAERRRKGRNVVQYYYQVTFPVAGSKPANKHVYIATENTLTHEKQEIALAKALAIRKEGERLFREAKRRDQQAEGKRLRASDA
jgi:hypothetical protein